MKNIFIVALLFTLYSLLFFIKPKIVGALFYNTAQSENQAFTMSNFSRELIINGDFEGDFAGWSYSPDVEIITDDNFGKVAKMRADDENSASKLIQPIPIQADNRYFLYVVYKLTTAETYDGFDEPSFIVLLDNKLVYADFGSTHDWKQVIIPLPPSEFSELEFRTRNTADSLFTPELLIAYVSTDRLLSHAILDNSHISQEIPTPVTIENISQYSSQFGTYFIFDNPSAQLPIFKYELSSASHNYDTEFTFATLVDNTKKLPMPTLNSSFEILAISSSVMPGTYQLNAFDAHDRILAIGTLSYLLE